jgi:hypothetical protein
MDDMTDTSVTAGNADSGWNVWSNYRFQGGLAGAEEDDFAGPAGIWGVFDGGL